MSIDQTQSPLSLPDTGIPTMPKLKTAYGHFLLPASSPSTPAPSVLLRGVNLSSSSKFPPFSSPSQPSQDSRAGRDEGRLQDVGWRTDIPAEDGWWAEAEAGGKEGWFVGRPLQEEGADVHFKRLRAWGFTALRWIIPWEALEHAGPGKYDEAYIEYTIRLMRVAKSFGFRIYISPHQDVFSRFTGGSGAPYWVLLACGINPKKVHATGAAVLQSQWPKEAWGGEEGIALAEKGEAGDYPDMIWNSNTGRLASRHCFAMFWASDIFAPKCKIDGESVGIWLQRHHVAAYAHLAKRTKEAGDLYDDCLIGWDSMNEPHEGLLEVTDMNDFPASQQFRKGPSPTPIQGFQLGIGQSVSKIENSDFGSTGLKKKGTVTMTPTDGEGLWLTREEAREAESKWGWKWSEEWDFWDAGMGGCIWAGHGVWDPKTGKALKKDYFHKKADGSEYQFIDDFWKPAYIKFIQAIRQHHPDAISLINPPIFEEPPNLDHALTGDRLALSAHFYDGLTMMGKRRHLFNADTVGLQRGVKSMLRAIKFGDSNLRANYRDQLSQLSSDASKKDGMAGDKAELTYPTIIGEMGTPWDMKEGDAMLGLTKGRSSLSDYSQSAKAMDQLLDGCDGDNPLSYTLWAYEPLNTKEHGDGWNGEDMSLFSLTDLENDDDVRASNPEDLQSLIMLGARGIDSWCRPYPIERCGDVSKFHFEMTSKRFELSLMIPSLGNNPLVENSTVGGEQLFGQTKIYVPFAHYVGKVASSDAKATTTSKGRCTGRPDDEGNEWIKGQGPARIDLDVLEISEGELEIMGQWAVWKYPLFGDKKREVKLVIKPWAE